MHVVAGQHNNLRAYKDDGRAFQVRSEVRSFGDAGEYGKQQWLCTQSLKLGSHPDAVGLHADAATSLTHQGLHVDPGHDLGHCP